MVLGLLGFDVALLYRGAVASCNYRCSYCPFGRDSHATADLDADRGGLARFVEWVANSRGGQLGVFFTPRGEALTHAHYRDAVVALSKLANVRKVVCQTNLSHPPGWLRAAQTKKVALWCSYHPGQTPRRQFLADLEQLEGLGVCHSVGMVGVRRHLRTIEAMRAVLPRATYLWINVDKKADYTREEWSRLCHVDPLAPDNRRHRSAGRLCHAGSRALAVDHRGDVRRCLFVDEIIGNICTHDLNSIVRDAPTACPNGTCGCHIGYTHMVDLDLYRRYGRGLLERIPE